MAAAALLIGCVLAWQFWLIWTLHTQVGDLQRQVCQYQFSAVAIADQLGGQGVHIVLPPVSAACGGPGPLTPDVPA